MTEIFAAFRSVPDYHAGPAPLVSIHKSLEGAIHALYPDREDAFRERNKGVWVGPDGFGEVRLMEIKP